MNDLLTPVLAIVFFLGSSAFFNGMEAAIFSISRFRVKTLLFEKRKGAKTLDRMKSMPGRTLSTLLLAGMLVNVAASSVAALVLLNVIRRYGLDTTVSFIIEFVLMTSIILIFGEIAPKIVAMANAEILALRFGKVIELLAWFFAPVSRAMESIMRRVLGPRLDREPDAISDKEIKLMLSEAKRFKVLDEGEEEFGYQILKFGKMTVSQIMTSRQKVVGIDIEAGLEQAEKVINEQKHSRICVFDAKGDVAGILYAKDLFLHRVRKTNAAKSIRDMMREVYVVPETKHVDSLLAEFRQKGIHMSIVVDEFGNFTGIVTLEDILESLFGEIVDEYDEVTDLPYEKVSPRTYRFEGDVSISDVVRVLHIEPFAPESERLSGYILGHFGRIPAEKERIALTNIELTVEMVRDRKIEKVLVRKL